MSRAMLIVCISLYALLRLGVALIVFVVGCINANEAGQDSSPDCTYDCPDSYRGSSLDYVLAKLTNNGLNNLTNDVTLSSKVLIKNLEGFRIIGYNNPTVMCSNGGGVHFLSCHNFTIEGIIWDNCGDQNASVIQFHNSSNFKIQNCSFRLSVGQAVMLTEVSGTVYINSCSFLNNS